MSDMKLPLSRRHLDIAIERLASRFGEAQRIRRAVANTIVAQLMTDCVIKGGSSLKFRYGDIATRVTKDMDVAQGADLDTASCQGSERLLRMKCCDYVHSGELGKQLIARIALAYFSAANR